MNWPYDDLPALAGVEDALGLLKAVYSNPLMPLNARMRAAEAALPFERPKLAAVISTNLSGEEFGNRLEAARKRLVEGPKPTGQGFVPKDPPRRGLPKP
jgi:hypothetical protein